MPDTQAFREKYQTGKCLCSLLPYVLACGSLQRCWWCISAYVSLVYTGSIPWGVPSCHAMILWRLDTFLPTYLRVCLTVFLQLFTNSTVYCLKVTEELLLMLTANVFDRVAYLMDNAELDIVLGNTLCIAPGKPFRPSMQHISISRTPLFWRSLRTYNQKLAPSLLETYIQRSSLWPSW